MTALLFCSGACALIYQTVWLREFRLVFGASTSATAAVLAIFLGGLGVGSAILGRRADAHARPLAFYGNLEIIISISAAASLLLLWLVRHAYIAAGGSVHLGPLVATIVRLVLATIVLAIPTFLMGGTLPAAARAVETSSDGGRRKVALLYACNTAGAVFGTLASTFFLLEQFGSRRTMLLAALVNVLVAIIARSMGRAAAPPAAQAHMEMAEAASERLPPKAVLVTAGVVGFAFLLMELVWYRMLGPILGGTTFTFGLILAAALLGIGIGGFAYSLWNRPSVGALALTTALEALLMILPFALGDRIALYAQLLRPLGTLGFEGHIVGWAIIAAVVILPASIVAGFQFPLLIALLGSGQEDVGRHVGQAYAWNTFGSILGSLGGGFGLIPLLSAPGAWKLVAMLLAGVSIVLAVLTPRTRRLGVAVSSIAIALIAAGFSFATGPTAAWRHSGIGAGRSTAPVSRNDARDFLNTYRRELLWDADGRESSVAMMASDDLAFVVNGKVDGSARGDAGTQVMAGILAATLHPNPRRALVIGLGTGSTSGWLGAIPSMERVDTLELEAVVLRAAKDCAVVNRNALDNPKVRIDIADAREVLVTSRDKYDLIFSEPSNPYRAGIASLFTVEFYRAAVERLAPGGLFAQWVQAYDIDASTLRTIFKTIKTVFPHVDTFRTTDGDLVLLASRHMPVYDIDHIRRRMATEPFRSAASFAWRAESAEAFLARLVANDGTATFLASGDDPLNTDDRTVVEFGFARSVASRQIVIVPLADLALRRGESRPQNIRGNVNWELVEANRATGLSSPIHRESDLAGKVRRFIALHAVGNLAGAREAWLAGPWAPVNSGTLAAIAESLADGGHPEATQFAENLGRFQPIERDVVLARLAYRQNRHDDAVTLLTRAFTAYRADPWPDRLMMYRALQLAMTIADETPRAAPPLHDALREPFSTRLNEQTRLRARLGTAVSSERPACGERTIAAIRAFEPNPLWDQNYLTLRATCYEKAGLGTLVDKAMRDLDEFSSAETQPITP